MSKILSPKVPNAPAPPPPAPTIDDQAVKDARKKSVIDAQRRSGRASTILSGDSVGL